MNIDAINDINTLKRLLKQRMGICIASNKKEFIVGEYYGVDSDSNETFYTDDNGEIYDGCDIGETVITLYESTKSKV